MRQSLRSSRLQKELKQKIPFRSREQEAYLALLRTADALQTSVEAKLNEFGLTGTQYNALRICGERSWKASPCSEIGERMIKHDPDVTRLLNRLENRGLVKTGTREGRSASDLRGITAAGLKLLREMDGPVEKHGREILKHVAQEKLQQLIELLELLRGGDVRALKASSRGYQPYFFFGLLLFILRFGAAVLLGLVRKYPRKNLVDILELPLKIERALNFGARHAPVIAGSLSTSSWKSRPSLHACIA